MICDVRPDDKCPQILWIKIANELDILTVERVQKRILSEHLFKGIKRFGVIVTNTVKVHRDTEEQIKGLLSTVNELRIRLVLIHHKPSQDVAQFYATITALKRFEDQDHGRVDLMEDQQAA